MSKPNQPQQLPLFFDEEEQSLDLPKVTWSYSRRVTLEQCARKYYFEYFASNKRLAGENTDQEVFRLKSLQNRFLRVGEILHLVIRTYFRQAQNGKIWEVDRLTNWARDVFEKDRAYSRSYFVGKSEQIEEYPPTLLREYYYHLPDAEALCDVEEERLLESLYSFATSPDYEEFRSSGREPSTLVEKRFSLQRSYYRVSGEIDLAYQDSYGVTIVDWKLGGSDYTGDDSLQLGAYSLWAVEHFNCNPDKLRIYKIHLSSHEIVSFKANLNVLIEVQARIDQDAERMGILQKYGEQSTEGAFTPCLHPAVCRSCSFERLCYA